MTAESGQRSAGEEAWSALVDGQADPAQASRLCGQWRTDVRLRESWHAYHLIGDALRSDELAGGARDAAFVGKLRVRLASEPVVLAPPSSGASDIRAAGSAAPRRRLLRRWGAPVGVAAGVALVAGTLTVTRVAPPGSSIAPASLTAAAPTTVTPVVRATDIASGEIVDGSGSGVVRVVRDPRLDSYLAAHKQLQGASALGPTPEFLRSATYAPAASAR
jgi:sigma-E factor negative regulatory protein RseA